MNWEFVSVAVLLSLSAWAWCGSGKAEMASFEIFTLALLGLPFYLLVGAVL